MGQQISIEAALGAFRRKYGEAADENVLLHARVAELEQENAELRAARDGQGELAQRAAEQPATPYLDGDRQV